MARFPTLYISHGSPMLLLQNHAARDFLSGYGRELGRPKAILVATAHFETRIAALTTDARPAMIYDFGGFPQALFEMQYPAPGDPALAQRAIALLAQAGVPAAGVANRGYDHGTWMPLKLLYPEADVPVVQISVLPMRDGAYHARMGALLAPLRDEGVMIVGSGSITHNLSALSHGPRVLDAPTPEWVSGFSEWVRERIEAGALEDIAHVYERAPHARENHPSPEHYWPLPFAMGAAGGAPGRRVHSSHQYGVLMMDTYAFA